MSFFLALITTLFLLQEVVVVEGFKLHNRNGIHTKNIRTIKNGFVDSSRATSSNRNTNDDAFVLRSSFRIDHYGDSITSLQRPCSFWRSAQPFSRNSLSLSQSLNDDDDIPTPEELEDMGGDPFFLTNDDDNNNDDYNTPTMEELDDMGGDSSFLSNNDNENKSSSALRQKFSSAKLQKRAEDLEAEGGDSFFLSEGDEEEEEVALDEEDMEMMMTMPSSSLLSMAGSLEDTMDMIESRKNNESQEIPEEDLLAMGGDPSFLNSLLSPEDAAASATAAMQQSTPVPAAQEKSYDEQLAELEDMGGDSFFLTNDDDDEDAKEIERISAQQQNVKSSLSTSSSLGFALDGKGPQRMAKEEDIDIEDWDGEAVEGSHFDDNM